MNFERLFKAIITLVITIGLVYYTTTISYDSDDVLSTSNYNDTVGPLIFIALISGIYSLIQFYKFFTNK